MANVIDSTYNTQVANAKSYASSAKENAKSQIDTAQSADIAAINKRYSDAVAQGDISIKDAKIAYDKDIRSLNNNYYNETKNADLYSQSMGIQGTNQALGVMAATSERQAGKVNERSIQRQNTIDKIRADLNKLRSDTDYDINSTKSRYGSELRGMYSQIDMNLSNQIGQYAGERGNKYFQQSERVAGQQFQSSESQKQRDFQAKQDAANRASQERISSQQYQYHTPDKIIASVKGKGYVPDKNGRWYKPGEKDKNGKQVYYNSPEQVAYMTTKTQPSQEDAARADSQFKSLESTLPESVFKTNGDFTSVDPMWKLQNDKYSVGWGSDNEVKPIGWGDWGVNAGGSWYPTTGGVAQTNAIKSDVSKYNSYVEKYTNIWNSLPDSVKASGVYKEPPNLRKWKDGKIVEVKNKNVKK